MHSYTVTNDYIDLTLIRYEYDAIGNLQDRVMNMCFNNRHAQLRHITHTYDFSLSLAVF